MFKVNNSISTEKILNDPSLKFLEKFIDLFEDRRKELLKKRTEVQSHISSGGKFSFPEDKTIREGNWKVVPPPQDVAKRNVEIT